MEVVGHKETVGRPGLYATTRQFLNDLSLTTLQELPMLDDAQAQAASVAQRVIEFEGDQAVAVDQVIDVVDTSSTEEPASVDAADNIENNEKAND